MKHFLHFLGTIILTAIISLIVAVLFGLLHYLGYLLSWVEKPTIMNILGMALILWTIMLLHGLISVVVFMYHCCKTHISNMLHSKRELAGMTINPIVR